MNKILILLAILSFLGCSFAPKHITPEIKLPTVEDNRRVSDFDSKWWKRYNDKNLETLIDEALKNNDDIQIAVRRVLEYGAIFNLSERELFPRIDSKGGILRGKNSENIPPYYSATENQFSLSMGISYEIDFWGKLKNQKLAYYSNLLGEKYASKIVTQTVVFEVIRNYLQIAAINQQKFYVQSILDNLKETSTLRKIQYKHGIISDIVLEQTDAQINELLLNMELLEKSKKLTENNLSYILGKEPQEIFTFSTDNFNTLNTISVPKFIPSEVLLQRPDIKRAEEILKAANFQIGVAKAQYFPNISLTGNLGFQSSDLSNLFSSGSDFWNIGGTLTAPIFNFGRISANVRIAEERQKQALLNYVKTVKNAFREIHDILINLDSIQKSISLKEKQIENYKRIYENASKKYERGLLDYINVIDANRQILLSEQSMVELKKEFATYQAQFFKALGY